MFNVIETQEDGTIVVHAENVNPEDVKRIVYNVSRRAKVVGEVSAQEIVEEVVESDFAAQDGYISFGDAARMLQVRYQQVFQRAVTKNKMGWRQVPENQVLLADVLEWRNKRATQ
jgi:predicted transcriptional regulator